MFTQSKSSYNGATIHLLRYLILKNKYQNNIITQGLIKHNNKI